MSFKSTKQVIIPVFQLIENTPIIVTFTGAFYIGEKVEKDKEPATLAPCMKPETGELGLIVANEVLKSTLVKAYPGDAYVGKTFEITKLAKREGKNYNGFRVNEGEYTPDPTPATVADSSAPSVSTAPAADSPAPVDAGKKSAGKK